MQIDDAAIILAGADFFEICSDEERRMLAFASERKRYTAGSTISSSGEVPEGAQVLVSGSISVTADSGGEPNPHVVSQSGAVINAMALVVARKREVTVTAVSVVETLFVPRIAFMKLARQSPDLAGRAADRIRRDMGRFVSSVKPLREKFSKK